MMKKKRFLAVALLAAMVVVCIAGFITKNRSKELDKNYDHDKEEYVSYERIITKELLGIDEKYENADELYKRLSQKQKECIAEKLSCDLEDVHKNLKEYSEAYINSLIYGYGCGLYKQDAGIEKNGLTYSIEKSDNGYYYDSLMDKMKDNEKKITYNQAYEIRAKEEKLKLDDFFKYKYIVRYEADLDGRVYREVLFPVEEYEGLYVEVIYYEHKDGKVQISRLGFMYNARGKISLADSGSVVMGFYEGKVRLDSIINKDSGKKYYVDINYTSNTKRTLDIQILNLSGKDLKVYPSYEIYKKQGDKLEKLEDYCYEASDEDMYLASEMLLNDEITSFLYFAIGKDDLEKGEYLIKYGEENKGDVYSEMSFMVD